MEMTNAIFLKYTGHAIKYTTICDHSEGTEISWYVLSKIYTSE